MDRSGYDWRARGRWQIGGKMHSGWEPYSFAELANTRMNTSENEWRGRRDSRLTRLLAVPVVL